MPTFSPPLDPAVGSSKPVETRVLRANFGDGYTQRAADGLNVIIRKPKLKFDGLTEAQADTIEAFLEAREGHENFDYTLPNESTSRKFICQTWTRTPKTTTGFIEMTLDLEEVFDI